MLILLIGFSANLFTNMGIAHTQNEFMPIYSGRNLDNFYWSSDSSRLVFQARGFKVGVVLDNPDYFQYHVTLQTFTQTNVWPLQPTLSLQEEQVYQPYVYPEESIDYENENDFMFLSPNQRFMIYITDPENPSLAIADRQLVAAKQFDTLAGNTLETRFFFAMWGQDNKGVLVGNHPIQGDFPRYFYISNFESDVQDATIQELPGIVDFGEETYSTGTIRDINSDSTLLLTSSTSIESLTSGDEPDTRLAIFKALDMNIQTIFANTKVRKQIIIAAAFDPEDEHYLLALTQDGIQRYNTVANTWTMLNPEINSTWADYAQFSPDGRYIVIEDITDHSHSLSDVYVIDLTQIF